MRKLKSIPARRLTWDFSDAPKYWAQGSAGISHFLNVYTLLVPDNEKYYIRTLNACKPRITDERLLAALIDFSRQESLHGLAHHKHGERLRELGLHTDALVRASSWFLYSVLEKCQPLRLRVSIVAAIEHINATWAHAFLELDLLKDSNPEVKRLFEWHFAEEIEHKAVANDVLAFVFPGYVTRVVGALLAFPTFFILIGVGAFYLLVRDKQARIWSNLKDLFRFCFRSSFASIVAVRLLRYFSRAFDPWDLDDAYLARRAISNAMRDRGQRTVAISKVG